jgi:threonine-phosphate decarboxylase
MKINMSHGGNIEEVSRLFSIEKNSIVDFSSNVNPFDLPNNISDVICASIRNISRYPDRDCEELKETLGKYLNISTENIVLGNGSADIIYRAVYAYRPSSGFILSPTFGEYEKALLSVGAKIDYWELKECDDFKLPVGEVVDRASKLDMVFLCNPNNPTGTLISPNDLKYLAQKLHGRKTILILDEAFIDLTEEHSIINSAVKRKNILVLRSMTKFFGLAGLRLGYAVGSKEIVKQIQKSGQPWPVNIFAQVAGQIILKNKKFKNDSRRKLLQERDFLYRKLCRIKNIKPFPTAANFILVKIEGHLSAAQLQKQLLKCGLLVRDCSSFRGLNSKYIRIAVRKHEENLRLINELEEITSKGIKT